MSDLSTPESTTLNTLTLLETRLNRLTYLLTGDTSWSGVAEAPSKPRNIDETVARRLEKLESDLERLRAREGVVGDLLGVYDRFPDLFKPSSSSLSQSSTTQPNPEDPDAPDSEIAEPIPSIETQRSILLSLAPSINETSSRLSSLSETPLPSATLSTSLIAQIPRMSALSAKQDAQAKEIAELRVQTANLLRRYYEVSVLGAGEVWGEWEGRLEGVRRGVRRGEVRLEREGV
ncbi:putative nuclear distribution protein RO10 [Aspergillus stella-maris]|uniref:putative nuclear distribution protein RO10 n=1 Tax=Aspergillus stella-maris TaxID=1810926 RepID=UPI003CCD1827